MSQELKNRTKKFALDVIGLCAGLPHLPERRGMLSTNSFGHRVR